MSLAYSKSKYIVIAIDTIFDKEYPVGFSFYKALVSYCCVVLYATS